MRKLLSGFISNLGILTTLVLFIAQEQFAHGEIRYRAIKIIAQTPNESVYPGIGLNNRGQVPASLCQRSSSAPPCHAGYVDSRGQFHDIHSWNDEIASGGVFINSRGQIAGVVEPPYPSILKIFRYTPWRGVEEFESYDGAQFLSMNSHGAILVNRYNGGSHWSGRCIGCPHVEFRPDLLFYSMNDNWEIVATDELGWSVFLIDKKGKTKNISKLFGGYDTYPSFGTTPIQINNRGSILAYVPTNFGEWEKVVLDSRKGTRISIPPISPASTGCRTYSSLVAINNRNTVIGVAPGEDCSTRAFVWSKAHGTLDLNTLVEPALPFIFWEVTAINDVGEILVHEPSINYSYNYYLLRPIDGPRGRSMEQSPLSDGQDSRPTAEIGE